MWACVLTSIDCIDPMRTTFLPIVLLASFAVAAIQAEEASKKPQSLFNGKTLEGWEGREDLWSVEDGQIVGRTSDDDPIAQNTFLVYRGGEVGDFELNLRFKIESGNSGVQYRSRVIDEEKFVVGGYQADIDFGNKFAGILYEEKGRGILATRGQKVTIESDGTPIKSQFADAIALGKGIHPGQWNDFRVVAKGNVLQHYINGTMTAEVIDEQPEKAAERGVIALQLHRGPAMVVRFKDIALSELN